MKLLSYSYKGTLSWGAISGEYIVDLQAATDNRCASLRCALSQMSMSAIEDLATSRAATIPIGEVEYLPVVPDAPRIFCVGLNYDEHRIEAKRETTTQPTVFLRVTASQVGHEQPIVIPRESTSLDFEGEIAVVIGKGGRRISEAGAWEHVAGYAPYNDGSIRDWQAHTTQWTSGKNFPGTGAFGPWMVTRGEIADGQELALSTRLNGQVVQHATTAHLIFPIPRLISYISTFTVLEPGDVIVTGTPGGVGFKRQPPLFMKPHDVVEVEVEGVGILINRVLAE